MVDKIEGTSLRGKEFVVDNTLTSQRNAGSDNRFFLIVVKDELDERVEAEEMHGILENTLESKRVNNASLGVVASIKACKSKRGLIAGPRCRGRGSPGTSTFKISQ